MIVFHNKTAWFTLSVLPACIEKHKMEEEWLTLKHI